MKPFTQKLLADFVGFSVLATISLGSGLVINQLRDTPMRLIYTSKSQRLDSAVSKIAKPVLPLPISSGYETRPKVIDLSEFQKIVESRQQIILDARPEIFHRLGHVPGALSLARDDFESAYRKLRDKLESNKNQVLAIYCSSSSCEDSHLVEAALLKLGYTNISVFSGGWDAWNQAGLTVETAP